VAFFVVWGRRVARKCSNGSRRSRSAARSLSAGGPANAVCVARARRKRSRLSSRTARAGLSSWTSRRQPLQFQFIGHVHHLATKAARASGVLTGFRATSVVHGPRPAHACCVVPHDAPSPTRSRLAGRSMRALAGRDDARPGPGAQPATPWSAAGHLHPASSLGEADVQLPNVLVEHAVGRRPRKKVCQSYLGPNPEGVGMGVECAPGQPRGSNAATAPARSGGLRDRRCDPSALPQRHIGGIKGCSEASVSRIGAVRNTKLTPMLSLATSVAPV
jgi:hypothetical protein